MKFPFSYQSGNGDCGPACLKMIAAYYDQYYELEFLKKQCRMRKTGVSMYDIFRVGKAIGFHCTGLKMTVDHLKKIVIRAPLILHYNENHFVVLYKTTKLKGRGVYHLADPARGLIRAEENVFEKYWLNKISVKEGCKNGYALLVEPASKILHR